MKLSNKMDFTEIKDKIRILKNKNKSNIIYNNKEVDLFKYL